MATPTTSLGFQNFFQATLTSDITASSVDIFLDNVPTVSQGFLVIEPDSSTNREVIFYTSKTSLKVVCSSAADGRGQDDTTAVAHSTGATVIMAPVAGMFEALQSGAALTDGAITPAKLIAGTGTSWATSSFTPTFTNLTIGNGTISARYKQIGKLVQGRISVVFGSTTSISGDVSFTLPVAATAYAGTANVTPIGDAQMYDVSAARLYFGKVSMSSSGLATIRAQAADLPYLYFFLLGAGVPFTWATGDEIGISFEYEAA